ncbi:hypothetical protein DRO55_02470 [Candidatus Bathyarchaeota archaeon]|nr:MAG: hypothetical protein DRO55_02470 [Candidatus Bathyarchaeota archaeon]
MRLSLSLSCMVILILLVELSLPVFMRSEINSPGEATVTIREFEECTLAVVDGDNNWAHLDNGILIIDLNGEVIGRREVRTFGSESDPIFEISNNRVEDMECQLILLLNGVPRRTIIRIYVKTSYSNVKSFWITSFTKEGGIGSFTLRGMDTARFWIGIYTIWASSGEVEAHLRVDGSLGNVSLEADILNFNIKFKIG